MGSLTLYFDRCFGRRFPNLVEALKPPFGVQSHYGINLKDDAPDDEWLKVVGAKGWVVLSHDARFHRDSSAVEAIKQFKVGCFYLWGGSLPIWNKAALMLAVYPKMQKIIGSEKRPYIYKVASNGRIHLVRHWDGRKEPKKHQLPEPGVPASRP